MLPSCSALPPHQRVLGGRRLGRIFGITSSVTEGFDFAVGGLCNPPPLHPTNHPAARNYFERVPFFTLNHTAIIMFFTLNHTAIIMLFTLNHTAIKMFFTLNHTKINAVSKAQLLFFNLNWCRVQPN